VSPGQWRVAFDAAVGGFETSHVAECPEVAPECATTFIPPHEHHVTLDLTHVELTADYGLRANAQLSLRLPYDIKRMRVRYTTLDGAPFVPPYGDIHHRSETLRGVSDPSLAIEWAMGDRWQASAGTSLPFGHIEPDPIVLGEEGKTHEHIQFGSGTFEPRLGLQWMRRGRVTLFARGDAILSLYENREGFRAPTTLLWSVGPSVPLGRASLDTRFTGQHQTIGRWSGTVDEGSGFTNGGLRLQLSLPIGRTVVAPGVYRELFSHGANGETFRQKTTFSLAVVRSFP
jgi:hypothetical protein